MDHYVNSSNHSSNMIHFSNADPHAQYVPKQLLLCQYIAKYKTYLDLELRSYMSGQ